jgi:hypothetical protein
MLRVINSIQIKWEKEKEAAALAKRVDDHLKTHYPDVERKTFWRRFFPRVVHYWMTDVEDLASWDEYNERLSSDEEYQELMRQAQDYLLFDTFDVVLLSSV